MTKRAQLLLATPPQNWLLNWPEMKEGDGPTSGPICHHLLRQSVKLGYGQWVEMAKNYWGGKDFDKGPIINFRHHKTLESLPIKRLEIGEPASRPFILSVPLEDGLSKTSKKFHWQGKASVVVLRPAGKWISDVEARRVNCGGAGNTLARSLILLLLQSSTGRPIK